MDRTWQVDPVEMGGRRQHPGELPGLWLAEKDGPQITQAPSRAAVRVAGHGGKRLCRCDQVGSGAGWALNAVACPLPYGGNGGGLGRRAEDEAMGRQGGCQMPALAIGAMRPQAKEGWQPPGAGRGQKVSSPGGSRGSAALLTPGSGSGYTDFGLPASELRGRIPAVLSTFLQQPQKTNSGSRWVAGKAGAVLRGA